MPQNSFVDEVIEGTLNYKGKNYTRCLRKYSWGDTDTLFSRVDERGTLYSLDSKSRQETVDIPGELKIDHTWVSSDGAWRYEIKSLSGTLTTPNDRFENCLVIKAEQLTGRDKEKLQVYYNYYAKGIGYVGSKLEKGLMAYLEKWELK
ncbi:hypothetical protein SAMN04488109_6721 [Chryseolinea serpens]|uniref:Uncharacterized protein n=2 Tax=Chryseolinea serpens TaxID=947013 RepID=A0A1M5XM82_9BACT|nr:hypothetical protein SAMN04488109_6721 [Chryseolinea serpens]